jgi:outer membrane protein
VETIYWGLVQAYEDVQAKERALDQSTKLLGDNRKQLEIGTMAPLDVVNAESTVATDKQALISAQSALNYQQQIIKQAIARNLNDPALSAAAGDSHRPREPRGDSRREQPVRRWCRRPSSSGRSWSRPC